MSQVISYLASIDPRLPNLLLVVVILLAIYAWKRFSPGTWNLLPTRLKALPAAVVGAALAGASTSSLGTLAVDAIMGALAGVTAVGSHEMLARLLLWGVVPSTQDRDVKDVKEQS